MSFELPPIDQTSPITLTFKECYVTKMEGKRVSQTVLSLFDPNFREEIPSPKSVSVKVIVCDEFFSTNFEFHSKECTWDRGFTIKPCSKCGSEDVTVKGLSWIQVECECGQRSRAFSYGSRCTRYTSAIEAWNNEEFDEVACDGKDVE